MSTSARLILARAVPATVLNVYRTLIASLMGDATETRRPWMIVPSLQRRYPFPAASSPPWQLEGAILALQAAGASAMSVWLPDADASLHRFADICERYGVPRAIERPPLETNLYNMLVLPTLRRGPRSPLGGACWLIHQYASNALAPSGAPDSILASLAAVRNVVPIIVAVMDATTLGNGSPGRASEPQIGNLLAASNDPVALDRCAAALLDIRPEGELPFLVSTERPQFGGLVAPPQIEGEPELAQLRWPGRAPGRFERAERFASWSPRDRAVYTSWLYDTEWGRLFAGYYHPRRSSTVGMP